MKKSDFILIKIQLFQINKNFLFLKLLKILLNSFNIIFFKIFYINQ